MPDDSYVLKYLQFLGKFLSVGPPVLFVLNNTGNLHLQHFIDIHSDFQMLCQCTLIQILYVFLIRQHPIGFFPTKGTKPYLRRSRL